MNFKKISLYVILLLLLLPFTYSCQKEQPESVSEKAAPGKPLTDTRIAEMLASVDMRHFTKPVKAPDFELNSVPGDRVSLSQYRGKVVLLSFWATW